MSGTAAGPAERAAVGRRPRPRLRPERLRELSLLAVIGVSVLVFSQLVDNYLSGSFFNRVTTSMAITAVLAAAQTIVILTRNIDLSVGSIVGVTAYVTGEYLAAHQTPAPVLAVGLAMGMALRPRARERGARGLRAGAGDHRHPWDAGDLPDLADQPRELAHHHVRLAAPLARSSSRNATLVSFGELDIRRGPAVAVVVIVALQLAARRGSAGAAGSTPSAPTRRGPPGRAAGRAQSPWRRSPCAGPLSGLAGFLFLSRFGTITVAAGHGPGAGQSVAAAVVGGVSILGGSGRPVGALLGALLIDLLDLSLLRVPGMSEFWRDAVLGALILTRGRGRLPPSASGCGG